MGASPSPQHPVQGLHHLRLAPVSHRQVVFTIPKALRGLFRRDRRLLSQLCRWAWETLAQMYQTAFPEEDVRGGAVIAIQTAGDRLQWHPHLHGLVPDTVWTAVGRRLSISYLDSAALTRIFQAQVLNMLVEERRLSPEFRRECRRNWARLIQKIYEVDPLTRPYCGSEMHIIAFVDDRAVIRRILEYLHLWDLPARPPPASLLGRKMDALLPDRAPDPETAFPSDPVFRDDVPPYAD